MLPKFLPDLFAPIHLPRIKGWQAIGQAPKLAEPQQPIRISSGYRACRWMQQLTKPANDN